MVSEFWFCWYLNKDLLVLDEGFVGTWWRICLVFEDRLTLLLYQMTSLGQTINILSQLLKTTSLTPRYFALSRCTKNAKIYSDIPMLDKNAFYIRFALLDNSWNWFHLPSEIVQLKRWWQKGIKDNPLRFLLHFRVFVN